MNGLETTLDWHLIDKVIFLSSISYVKGDLVDINDIFHSPTFRFLNLRIDTSHFYTIIHSQSQ